MSSDCGLARAARVALGLQFVARMKASTSGLVLALGLVFGWSAVHAAPHGAGRHKKAKRPVKVEPVAPVDDDVVVVVDDEVDGGTTAPAAKQVALEAEPAASDLADDRDAKVVKSAAAPAKRGWHLALGPYLWASSVSANVSLDGPVSPGVDIGFIPITQHAKYGVEALVELRRGRFALYGDLMYGVVGISGTTDVASLMVKLDGSASSLLIDGAAGYQVIGDDDARFSLEARAGVRYQRTAINGEIGIADYTFHTPESADGGADALVGTRAVVRPWRWLALSGVFDSGVAGASNLTWSATADAALRISSRVTFALGWRTLTMERSLVNLSLQGPRAALQVVLF